MKFTRLVYGTIVVGMIAGMAAFSFHQHHLNRQLQEENESLRSQLKELDQLRAEAKGARQFKDLQAEMEQLREDNKDLLRLRSEARRVHEKAAELENLQAANARLLQMVQEKGGSGTMTSNQAAELVAVRKQGAVLGVTYFAPESSPPNQRYRGVVISSILANAPAAQANLRPGDIIYRIDGHPIENPAQLQSEILGKKPGVTVQLSIMRGDTPLQVAVQTRDWPQ